ncbi:cytidine/deoxycytidylate deaminase family protein [bacterium]
MKKLNKRPTWDEYFMSITQEVAKRSTCMRRQVGAVLVKDKRILSTGYNGAVKGLKHCYERENGCYRKENKIPSGQQHELCRGVHAEQNALLFACSQAHDTKGAVLYSSVHPCVLCAKMIVQAGIKRIVYARDYQDDFAVEILNEAGVELVKYEAKR